MSPDIAGDTLVTDSETSEVLELTVDAQVIAAVERAWYRRAEAFHAWARKHGVGYVAATPSAPLGQLIERITARTAT